MQLTRDALTDETWPAREGELRRLHDRVAAARPRPRWWVVAAMAMAAALPATWLLLRRPTALTFEVVNGTVGASGEIGSADRGTRIHFSDGSEVMLDDAARTQVRDLAADGARIVLTEGRAHTSFIPRPHARWQVAAGPYLVQVTGTVFDIRWSDKDQAFDVWLNKGSVTVQGPLIGGGIVMTHGQHLLTRLRDNRIVLDNPTGTTSEPAASVPEPAGAEEDEAPGAAAAPVTPSRRESHAGPALDQPWSQHLARGDFEAVIAAAERRGIDAVLARGSRRDLSALADAARYTRRGTLAQRALHAERSRFPGSAEGREAAYFLGNLAEDEGSARSAATWFERYRRENPSGTYSSQALGRTMVIHARERNAAAGADAQEYLRRYPTGSYAEAARRIIDPQ